MARNEISSFDHAAQAICHDHLEGSAHCVECAGPCSITDPTQAALTCIVRSLFESEVAGFAPEKIPYRLKNQLLRHGIDCDKLAAHAGSVRR